MIYKPSVVICKVSVRGKPAMLKAAKTLSDGIIYVLQYDDIEEPRTIYSTAGDLYHEIDDFVFEGVNNSKNSAITEIQRFNKFDNHIWYGEVADLRTGIPLLTEPFVDIQTAKRYAIDMSKTLNSYLYEPQVRFGIIY